MLNEVDVYKCIHDKEFHKCKHVMVSFLKTVYNQLWDSQKCDTMKFTLTTDAIFYLLSRLNGEPMYTSWSEYSHYLKRSLNDAGFPNYLKAKIVAIQEYHDSSLIMSKHSNERLLLEIVVKLLKRCTEFGDDMDCDDGGEDKQIIEKLCGYFDGSECVTLADVSALVEERFQAAGASSFADIIRYFEQTSKHLFGDDPTRRTIDECLERLQELIRLGVLAGKALNRHGIIAKGGEESLDQF